MVEKGIASWVSPCSRVQFLCLLCQKVSLFGSLLVIESNFFASCVKRIRDGQKTMLWHDVWVGLSARCVPFKRLFHVLEQKPQVVGFMGAWKGTYECGVLGGYNLS